MGFFSSLGRFFSSLFGIAEGSTERATDAMVSANADTIRAQFRKTREDWIRDYHNMRDAVAELIRIREMRADEIKKLNADIEETEQKMAGAIELYKRTPDERYREAYGSLAARKEQQDSRVKELMAQVEAQNKQLEQYKGRLMEFQRQIEALGKEEAETVADIVSSQKIRELNDRLQGVSSDSQSKNLEAIRAARHKANAVAKLSNELSNNDSTELDKVLKTAGAGSKHISAFDQAVGKAPKVMEAEFQSLNAANQGSQKPAVVPQKDAVDAEIAKLLAPK